MGIQPMYLLDDKLLNPKKMVLSKRDLFQKQESTFAKGFKTIITISNDNNLYSIGVRLWESH